MAGFEINLKSKFVQRLIDVVASGVGAVSRPWLMRRDARAAADATRIHAQALTDARAILEGRATLKDQKALVAVSVPDQLPEGANLRDRVQVRLTYQEAKRQMNLEAVTRVAAQETPDEMSDDEVDQDWITRFFTSAQDVTNEQMQQIWGRILAGEVACPGSYSMRALDVLKNMTQGEAQIFMKVAQFAIRDFIIRLDGSFFKDRGIKFADFLLLHELGLLHVDDSLVMNVKSDARGKFKRDLVYGDKVIEILHEDEKKELELPCYSITSTGVDLLKLIAINADEGYISEIAKLAKEKGFTVLIADIVARLKDGRIQTSKFEEFRA